MGEGIRWQIFENNGDDVFVNALAIYDTHSISALVAGEDEEASKESIFERYAAAGLELLDDAVVRSSGDLLDQLLSILQESIRATRTKPTGLEELSVEALEFLEGG
jgi:dnd system-associated protein 4